MREWLTAHAHSAGAFVAILAVALLLGATLPVESRSAGLSGVPAPPIDLPSLAEDADRDTYNDTVDRVAGDALVRIEVESLHAGQILPYLVVGTQDDQWRFGAGRELEWRHIVDPDPLGHRPGSDGWADHAIRTGAWWTSLPMQGASKAMAPSGDIDADRLDRPGWRGVSWPQTFHVNVRDDQDRVEIELALMDADPDPDRRIATWRLDIALDGSDWRVGDGVFGQDTAAPLTSGDVGMRLSVQATTAIPHELQQEIASRWAPELRFDSEERFFPTAGTALEQFHGFSRDAPADHDLRTWTLSFDNGRDGYVLLLADFDGDRRVDHEDATILTDVLRAGKVAPDTVQAQVIHSNGDRVVVQYWFIYIYNFVEDERGDGIAALAHKGDREFIQLVFSDLDAARNGTPESIAYSQHYRGIRIDAPRTDGPGFNGTHPLVYPARGSHASYPHPGDDRRFRVALAGFGDRFDGQGELWTADHYELELFDRQPWAFGHLWGPPTRYSRDLGTSTRPFLTYDFKYPYIDPLPWQAELRELDQDQLEAVYGAA